MKIIILFNFFKNSKNNGGGLRHVATPLDALLIQIIKYVILIQSFLVWKWLIVIIESENLIIFQELVIFDEH